MKKISLALALAAVAFVPAVRAINLSDIQLWTGSGTNRAALVIEWNSPQVLNNSTVPAPVANKTLVWGYQFNGESTGARMINAILASDPRLYAVIVTTYGTYVEGFGYNLDASGIFGVTDGTHAYSAAAFVNGRLRNPNLNIDAASPLNPGDLFWSGYYGPNWNVWNELGDSGGFSASPNRGTNQFWDGDTGIQGEWEFAEVGLDDMPITNGSWLGFSVAAAGYDTNAADPATAAFNYNEQAPPSPDGSYAAYVGDTNEFAVQVVSSSGLYYMAPYTNPAAVLGPPTLKFVEQPMYGGATNRTSIIDPPYNDSPNGSAVIAEITNGGQITVRMGRRVYHNPGNPYGVDLIVYGNSFFSVPAATSQISDLTDLDSAGMGGGTNGHTVVVSVSPDGTNWYAYSEAPRLFPQNSYRWDEPNHSWTDEQFNPTKPLDPAVYSTDFLGRTVASVLDQFVGSAGGTGYNLQESGFPWIQFVRVEPETNTTTVIDAIAVVNPVVEGDATSISPGDLDAGMTNVSFQNPADTAQTLVSVNFESLSGPVKISAVALTDFSSFAPVPGAVSRAGQITVSPSFGTDPISFVADAALSVGAGYTGDGSDLRVLQWNGAGWTLKPFEYDSAANQVSVAGLTNLSAIVVSRLAPQLNPQFGVGGLGIPVTSFPNVTYTLLRSTDLLKWTSVTNVTPNIQESLLLQDPNPPADQAFYRLLISQ